jgi:hypothetical protein
MLFSAVTKIKIMKVRIYELISNKKAPPKRCLMRKQIFFSVYSLCRLYIRGCVLSKKGVVAPTPYFFVACAVPATVPATTTV